MCFINSFTMYSLSYFALEHYTQPILFNSESLTLKMNVFGKNGVRIQLMRALFVLPSKETDRRPSNLILRGESNVEIDTGVGSSF